MKWGGGEELNREGGFNKYLHLTRGGSIEKLRHIYEKTRLAAILVRPIRHFRLLHWMLHTLDVYPG